LHSCAWVTNINAATYTSSNAAAFDSNYKVSTGGLVAKEMAFIHKEMLCAVVDE